LREDSKGDPVTVAELARELELDRSTVSRRARSAKDRGYLKDLEDNPRKPSRLVLGDDLPDDVQILPKPEDVCAGVKERAQGSARPDGTQEPHSNGQNSGDAYKACSRARVQEGIKTPPPPSGSEPGDIDNHQDTLTKEVRDLFASDALEEV
jgi:MarR family